jgi:hypothetical protein
LSSKIISDLATDLFAQISTGKIKRDILKAQTLYYVIKSSKGKLDFKIPVFAPKLF